MIHSLIILDLWKLILFSPSTSQLQSTSKHVQLHTYNGVVSQDFHQKAAQLSYLQRIYMDPSRCPAFLQRRQMLFRSSSHRLGCSSLSISRFYVFFRSGTLCGFPLPLALIMNPISGSHEGIPPNLGFSRLFRGARLLRD